MTCNALVLNLARFSNTTLVSVTKQKGQGWGVPEGMGGNGDVRGFGAGSGAA